MRCPSIACGTASQTHPVTQSASQRFAAEQMIRVYDAAGKLIETHEHAGEFKEW